MDIQKIFRVPVRAYDIEAGRIVDTTRYFAGEPENADTWQNQMIAAQRSRRRLCYSNEWSSAQRHYPRDSREEHKFITPFVWTGTVLDSTDGTLKEGIIINDDGTIKSAETVLGRNDGIVIPDEGGHLVDFPDMYNSFFAYLYGMRDPRRVLPIRKVYLWMDANGLRPVIRGGWLEGDSYDRRSSIYANRDPTARFAAWQVSDSPPEGTEIVNILSS